jgi:cell division protein FtsW
MPVPDATIAAPPRLRVLKGGTAAPTEVPLQRRTAVSAEVAGQADARRLGALVAALTLFGLVAVDAASPIASLGAYRSVFSIAERQVLWAALGAIAFLIAARCNLARLRRRARLGLVVVGGLLLAVLVPHLGKGSGGSSRWLGAGPITIQPSELAKLAFSLFAADFVARRRARTDQRREIVTPLAIIVGVLGVLILKQPDLGTAMVVVAIAAAAWYAGGVQGRLLATTLGIIALVGGILALSASYRRARLLAFLNPFGHASTVGYQLVQSLSALGSGHLTGGTISASPAAWFLPNAPSDFIFAAIGNDFGLLGGLAIVIAFGVIGWLGVRIASRTLDPFAALLASCITCWLVFQATINIGGVIGVLPDTGIPLPFLSAGGSALIVALAGAGLLVNIARRPAETTELLPPPRRLPGRPVRRRGSVSVRSGRTAARERPASAEHPRSAERRNPGGSARTRTGTARPRAARVPPARRRAPGSANGAPRRRQTAGARRSSTPSLRGGGAQRRRSQ